MFLTMYRRCPERWFRIPCSIKQVEEGRGPFIKTAKNSTSMIITYKYIRNGNCVSTAMKTSWEKVESAFTIGRMNGYYIVHEFYINGGFFFR